MIPPTAASAGRVDTISSLIAGPPERPRFGSDEENGHQNEDDDDDREDALHQMDKGTVGLLMGGVIVARGSGVLDFTMISHFKSLKLARSAADLA
jgi:hypothetical protein